MNNKIFLFTSLILLILTVGSFFLNKILSNHQQIYQKSIKQNNIFGEISQNNKILEINQALDNNQCLKPQEGLKKQIEKNNILIENLRIETDKEGILANILNYSKIKKYQKLIQENNKLIKKYNNQVINYNKCIFTKNKY